MPPTILGPDGRPISSESRDRRAKYIEGSVVEAIVDKARVRKRAVLAVGLTQNSLRGAVRRGNKRALRAGLKGTGRSLGSVIAEQAQQSRDAAKRIAAERKAAQQKRWEERNGTQTKVDAGS
jgi:hypothetical protein